MRFQQFPQFKQGKLDEERGGLTPLDPCGTYGEIVRYCSRRKGGVATPESAVRVPHELVVQTQLVTRSNWKQKPTTSSSSDTKAASCPAPTPMK